jgi:hypothetical protein
MILLPHTSKRVASVKFVIDGPKMTRSREAARNGTKCAANNRSRRLYLERDPAAQRTSRDRAFAAPFDEAGMGSGCTPCSFGA